MALAHRYVSANTGSDANPGTSPDQAWATIDHAASQDFSGNADGTDIHLAPGTYRETVVVDYPGAASRLVRFIGDPQGQWFPDEPPGRVRVTACNASEIANPSAHVITSAQDYVEWHCLHVDGGDRAFNFGAFSTVRKAVRCVIFAGGAGLFGGLAERCVAAARTALNAHSRWSVAVGAQNCFDGGTHYNSLGLGGQYGFWYASAYNCVSLGAVYAFQGGVMDHCLALNAYYATNDNPTKVASYYHNCVANTSGLTPAGPVLPDLGLLIDALPFINSHARTGSNVVPGYGSADTDISLDRLALKGTSVGIGPWSISEPADHPPTDGVLDWTTYHSTALSLRITLEGDYLFHVPAQSGRAVTVTVWTRHDGLTGSKPQMILRGDSISEQTATNTADDAQWQRLSLSATPTFDEVLTLILRARNSVGTCRFSDLAVIA